MNAITTRDGTQIYYRDWGDKAAQPIVFSHGWPLTGDAWEGQLLYFSGHGFRAIAHDRRGHGRSDQPSDGNDMNTYADDLAELIEALDLRDVVLVGHSTGGGEVARYIGRHGTSRLAKAVLLDAIPPLMTQTPDNPAGVPKAALEEIRAGVAGNRSTFYQGLTTPFFGFDRPGSKATEGMRDAFWLQGMQGGLKGQYETTFTWEEDYTQDLRKFDVPTLILHGDDDQIVPIEATARRAVEIVPNAVLKVYPGGNHGIAITDPERVNADLLAFIRGELGEERTEREDVLVATPIPA